MYTYKSTISDPPSVTASVDVLYGRCIVSGWDSAIRYTQAANNIGSYFVIDRFFDPHLAG